MSVITISCSTKQEIEVSETNKLENEYWELWLKEKKLNAELYKSEEALFSGSVMKERFNIKLLELKKKQIIYLNVKKRN
ncbi:hypothetical protein [Mycoplasmopsis edwardii]|uniref:hypothetical protein n=1 Tax=Mycoplasmopsis edwardii TaxID=53558 RepID=UPI000E3E3DA3|nr:hypothetical protein [Mycoplasmopsis edwardii]